MKSLFKKKKIKFRKKPCRKMEEKSKMRTKKGEKR